MITVQILGPAVEPVPFHKEALLPAVPRVGERLVIEPGLPREYEVESVRWVMSPSHPMIKTAGLRLAKVVVFVRPVEDVA